MTTTNPIRRETDMTTRFVTAETLPDAHLTPQHWQQTGAQSLSAAKSVARKRQMFHGTRVHVGWASPNGTYVLFASTDRSGAWVNYE